MKRYKGIFFDLDNTLLDFSASEKTALSQALEHFGIEPTDFVVDLYSRINDSQWKLLEKGRFTREEIVCRRFRILFDCLDIRNIRPDEMHSVYEKNLSQSCIVFDGVPELLENLSRSYRLFVMTNGTPVVQDGRMSRSGLEKYFENVFVSGKIGFNKPSKEYFDYCFSTVDFAPCESVIIGDSLSSDMAGGKAAGMKTVFISKNNIKAVLPDLTISSVLDAGKAISALENG